MKILYSYFVYFWLILAAITKGYALSHTYGVALASATVAVISDFCTLSIPFILCRSIRGKNSNLFKSFGALFALLYLATYLLDTLLLLGLNARLDFRAMNSNGLEWSVALTFLKEKYQAIIAFSVMLSILSFSKFNYQRPQNFYRTCIPILFILSGSAYSNAYSKYSFSPIYLIFSPFQEVQAPVVNDYSQLQAAYKKVTSESLNLPSFNKNIILLVVESLSAVDSKRMGGMYDRLPELDELSKKGILFKNYYGNHFNSEGGFISMLCGVPPVSYPGYTALGYRDYPCFANNVVREVKKDEYLTEFLTTGHLSYAQKGTYMRAIGFDVVRGRAEVPEFSSAERYSFSAPADSFLYAEALKTIEDHRERNQKFFLNLFTVSSHRPYFNPKDGGDTIESVFSYVGSEIVNFYNLLEEKGFFKEGILVVVGDHRRMDVIPEEELRVLGEKARNWVWLGLFGAGITPSVVDHKISQHTLIADILAVASGRDPRTTDSVAYTNPWDRKMNSKSGIIDLNGKVPISEESVELLPFRQAGYFIRNSSMHPCEKFERDVDDLEMFSGISADVHKMGRLDTLSREEVFALPRNRYSSFDEAIESNVSHLFPSTVHIQADINFNSREKIFLSIVSKSPTCLFLDGKLQAVTEEAGGRLTALPSIINVSGAQLHHIDFIAELNPFANIPRIEYLTSIGTRAQIKDRYAYFQSLGE